MFSHWSTVIRQQFHPSVVHFLYHLSRHPLLPCSNCVFHLPPYISNPLSFSSSPDFSSSAGKAGIRQQNPEWHDTIWKTTGRSQSKSLFQLNATFTIKLLPLTHAQKMPFNVAAGLSDVNPWCQGSMWGYNFGSAGASTVHPYFKSVLSEITLQSVSYWSAGSSKPDNPSAIGLRHSKCINWGALAQAELIAFLALHLFTYF